MKETRLTLSIITVIALFLLVVITAKADGGHRHLLSPSFDVLASESKNIKSSLATENVKFTISDFRQWLGVYDVESITVTKAPQASSGVLKVGSMTVYDGQKIEASLIPMLEFVAYHDDLEVATFSFCGDDGTSGTELVCTMRLLYEVNYAPSASEVNDNRLNICAVSGRSIGGSVSASDPEGDELFFEITKYTEHGNVRFVDKEHGGYVYVPNKYYVGTDGFEYVVRDEYGNYTECVRVNITVSGDSYSTDIVDMDDSYYQSAATVMLREGILTAKVRGGSVIFEPSARMSRAEFIVSAMKAAGIGKTEIIESVGKIKELSEEQMGYVSAALKLGYVTSEFIDGILEDITRSEAALVLSRLCGYEKSGECISVFADYDAVNKEHIRAVGAMYEQGIFELIDGKLSPNALLTKEDCARMLYKYMSVYK